MPTDPDCPFCRIARGEAPARFAEHPVSGRLMDGQTGTVMIFEPLDPCTPGHLLAVPTRHAASAADDPLVAAYTVEEAAEYMQLVGGDWNLITSIGAAATQTVRHLHLHLLPRVKDDGVLLPWTRQQRRRAAV